MAKHFKMGGEAAFHQMLDRLFRQGEMRWTLTSDRRAFACPVCHVPGCEFEMDGTPILPRICSACGAELLPPSEEDLRLYRSMGWWK